MRISHAGPDGDVAHRAFDASVAYASAEDEYLVVWAQGDEAGEVEVYGQRLAAEGGDSVGSPFRISTMGPDGDSAYTAQRPAVVYNFKENQYLVVWQGEHNGGTLVDDEFEIFAQRIDAATGNLAGAAVRVSSMGPDGDPAFDAFNPTLAYNSDENEYLVVWQGDGGGGLADNENEIYAQRLNGSTGQRVAGSAPQRVSSMGPNGAVTYRAQDPAVAYNRVDDEYLVVWSGDDDDAPLVAGEMEIFGQRLAGDNGAARGNRIRISQMGANGDPASGAAQPAVAHNTRANQYLVVWTGDENNASLADNELEIFGQRLIGDSGALSGDRLRISDAGPDGNTFFRAVHPAVVFQAAADRYLVTWRAEENVGDLVAGEHEIFGQWLDGSLATELFENDFRISEMGSVDGSTAFQADRPAVATSITDGNILVVWHGDDDSDALVDGEYEAFARLLDLELLPPPVYLPVLEG
jgi:hypothetical protein